MFAVSLSLAFVMVIFINFGYKLGFLDCLSLLFVSDSKKLAIFKHLTA